LRDLEYDFGEKGGPVGKVIRSPNKQTEEKVRGVARQRLAEHVFHRNVERYLMLARDLPAAIVPSIGITFASASNSKITRKFCRRLPSMN